MARCAVVHCIGMVDFLTCQASARQRRRVDRLPHGILDGLDKVVREVALADGRLRATPEQLGDALGACAELNGVFRRLLKMALEELELIETHIEKLEREAMDLMQEHQDAVQRVAEVPGFGLDSAMQMIAEVGPQAATFDSEKELSSW